MHELCEIRTDNYDSFNWKQALFGKRIPKKFVRKKSKSKFGTFCMALCSGLIKLSAMTKCSATNNCHESSKVKHSKIWDERLQAIRCPKHPLFSQWESSNVACALSSGYGGRLTLDFLLIPFCRFPTYLPNSSYIPASWPGTRCLCCLSCVTFESSLCLGKRKKVIRK